MTRGLGFSRDVTGFPHPLPIPALIQHVRRVHDFHEEIRRRGLRMIKCRSCVGEGNVHPKREAVSRLLSPIPHH